MMIGIGLIAIGYALLYWGYHHKPFNQKTYSLWALLGFGSLTKLTMPAGTPVQFKTS